MFLSILPVEALTADTQQRIGVRSSRPDSTRSPFSGKPLKNSHDRPLFGFKRAQRPFTHTDSMRLTMRRAESSAARSQTLPRHGASVSMSRRVGNGRLRRLALYPKHA